MLLDARHALLLHLVSFAGGTRRLAASFGVPVIAVALAGIVVLVQSPTDALAGGALVLGATVYTLIRARHRVVIEDFRDYTRDEATAVAGLSSLLIAELGRLQELYSRVADELPTAPSVAVTGRGGTGPATQPGAFLSVSADGFEQTIKEASATDAAVSIGPIKIPIGFVVSLLGRVARGPRVTGSLHHSPGTGGRILTAQIVGPTGPRQWTVHAPAGADDAVLERMVSELACRMFNDLTLSSSVRWRAIEAFTEHLELYWESVRAPRNRGIKLEQAEAKLLEAIAEDDRFDLAYYNLGVIYSELAETELAAAQGSGFLTAEDRPCETRDARLGAALVAFNRAVALNRDQADAIYGLAVHEFMRLQPDDQDALQSVICRCERVLELKPRHSGAHELLGIAQVQQGLDGEPALRAAVRESWRELRRVERRERSMPPTTDSRVPGARANLAAAVATLAQHTLDSAGRDRRRLKRADRLFERASALATGDTKAATLLAHGQMLERIGEPKRAVEPYHSALKIDPENPVYWAHLAAAHAAEPRSSGPGKDPATLAEGALDHLAPIYRRVLEPHPPRSAVVMRDETLGALSRVYRDLQDKAGSSRIAGLVTLAYELEGSDTAGLEDLKRRCEGRTWEREQVQIALARGYRDGTDREKVVSEYEELIELAERERPAALVQHSLRSKLAGALRDQGQRERALRAAADGELQNPLSSCARREVAETHFALGQLDQALNAWKHALWLTPNDPYLYWKVAYCQWKAGAVNEAATGFEHAALLFTPAVEGWAWSQLWAGRAHLALGHRNAALSHLRSAVGCSPTASAAKLLVGELLVGSDAATARAALEDVLAGVEPDGVDLDAGWGDTLPAGSAADRARSALARLEARKAA